ncbi:MAG: hypothetical protein ACJ79S_17885 [Gemmatimonadaceae bacterium]
MAEREIAIATVAGADAPPSAPTPPSTRLRRAAEAAAGIADHIPSPLEVARRLKAAHDNSAADAHQQLLLRELMAHYRQWCLRRDIGDPFAAMRAEALG